MVNFSSGNLSHLDAFFSFSILILNYWWKRDVVCLYNLTNLLLRFKIFSTVSYFTLGIYWSH